jgi:uridine kinase
MKPEICTSEPELVNRIGIFLNNQRNRNIANLVTIDGCYGVGKSTLATKLKSVFPCEIISLDDYFPKFCGDIQKSYYYAKISKNLKFALLINNLVILEGLFILKVLERTDYKASLSIYIQAMSKDREWINEVICSENDGLDEALAKIKRIADKFPPDQGINDQELIKYHKLLKPISHADILYERFE